jgi:hypothetical protein
MKTIIQSGFAPFKAVLPGFLWRGIRACATALMTPVIFSRSSGHFKSSLKQKAVSRNGKPLPWYTYPMIDFLNHRDFSDKVILEYGAGQSTLWWANKARRVISIETDQQWYEHLKSRLPANVSLHHVDGTDEENFITISQAILKSLGLAKLDIIIIDAEFRERLLKDVFAQLEKNGAVICDDAESYGFYDVSKDMKVSRIDFFGFSPGVVLPHCTSVYFDKGCFMLDCAIPIPDVAKQL